MKLLKLYYLLLILVTISCTQEQLDTCVIKTTSTIEVYRADELINEEDFPTEYIRWNYLPYNNVMYKVYLISEDVKCNMTSLVNAKEQVLEQNIINKNLNLSEIFEDKAKALYPNNFKVDENCDCK